MAEKPDPKFRPRRGDPDKKYRFLVAISPVQRTRMEGLAEKYDLSMSELGQQMLAFAMDHMEEDDGG